MFSKLYSVVAGVVLSFALAGCKWQPGSNLSVGEANKKSNPIQVKLSGMGCLSQIDKSISLYLDSNLSRSEILDVGLCVQEALKKFGYFTRDSTSRGYSPLTLVDFLNREYLTDNKLTIEFVREIMNLKSLVLGGEVTVLTRPELEEFIKLIALITEEAIKNAPYIKIYLLADTTSTKVKLAQNQLRSTSQVIAQLLAKRTEPYSVQSFEAFLKHSSSFFKLEKYYKKVGSIEKLVSLIVASKQLVGASNQDAFEPEAWSELLDFFATSYGLYLNYNINLKNRSFLYEPVLSYFIEDAKTAFDLLKRAISYAKNEYRPITIETIENFLTNLNVTNLLPSSIKIENLRPIYEYMLAEGLGLQKLNEFKNEFTLWAKIQSYLNGSLSEAEIANDKSLKAELKLLKNGFPPFFKAGDSRTFVLAQNDYEKFGLKSNVEGLSKLNLIRLGVRIVIRTFSAKGRTPTFSGLIESEMESFYDVVRLLGIDLHIIDPRKPNYGPNYLLEGSLFTFSGDGLPTKKNFFNFYEMSELVSLMLSGGAVRDIMYNRVLTACRSEGIKDGPLDVFDLVKIERSCFLKHFADNNFEEISNLPHMMVSMQETYRSAIEDLQIMSAIKCEDYKYIEQAEIASMVTILHYLEVLFSAFDRDKNNYFDSYEVMSAYYRFDKFLNRTVTSLKKKEYEVSMLKAIYFFLIKNKKMPTSGWNFLELKQYALLYFDDDPNQFKYLALPELKASRFDVLQVLRILYESSNMTNKKQNCLGR